MLIAAEAAVYVTRFLQILLNSMEHKASCCVSPGKQLGYAACFRPGASSSQTYCQVPALSRSRGSMFNPSLFVELPRPQCSGKRIGMQSGQVAAEIGKPAAAMSCGQ